MICSIQCEISLNYLKKQKSIGFLCYCYSNILFSFFLLIFAHETIDGIIEVNTKHMQKRHIIRFVFCDVTIDAELLFERRVCFRICLEFAFWFLVEQRFVTNKRNAVTNICNLFHNNDFAI